jgi:hypothetical protein
LPGFDVLVVLVVVVIILVVIVISVFVVVDVVIVIVVVNFIFVIETIANGEMTASVVAVCHDGVSGAGLTLSRLGGGYVVQKWRPQRGHTQNWSGVHGMPGPGSRMSIWVPQRMQRMWRSPSLIAAIL